MTRPLRVGDRVTATGTVVSTDLHYTDNTDCVSVKIDGDRGGNFIFDLDALTPITPAEPPVGSVVVKDGVAWTRLKRQMRADAEVCWCRQVTSSSDEYVKWTALSDGEVIFTPGGDA